MEMKLMFSLMAFMLVVTSKVCSMEDEMAPMMPPIYAPEMLPTDQYTPETMQPPIYTPEMMSPCYPPEMPPPEHIPKFCAMGCVEYCKMSKSSKRVCQRICSKCCAKSNICIPKPGKPHTCESWDTIIHYGLPVNCPIH